MAAALLLLLAAGQVAEVGTAGPPEVPRALTEVVPALVLRWREVALEREGRAVATLVSAGVAGARMSSSLLRGGRGVLAPGCEPVVSRVFRNAGTRAQVP